MSRPTILDKRFADRKEQIDKLMVYVELLGLTGEDLVSIGCRMARLKKNAVREQNSDIIAGFDLLPVGRDPVNKFKQYQRFKLKTDNGDYKFTNMDFGRWEVYSLSSKKKLVYSVNNVYDTKKANYVQQMQWALLLDIHHGKLLLNF